MAGSKGGNIIVLFADLLWRWIPFGNVVAQVINLVSCKRLVSELTLNKLVETKIKMSFQATVMVLEDGSERSAERMAKLLQSLNESCIITPEQMSQVGWKYLGHT